jgi:type IV pilus assembly protein PilW
MSNRYKKNASGFTLVELLVTMAITLIVVGAMYNVLDSSNRTYSIENEKVEAQNNLRAAVGLLTHELRMAGYDPTGIASPEPGFKVIPSDILIDGDTVEFTMDLNGDEDLDDDNEHVAYRLSSGNLERANTANDVTSGNYDILAENIQAIEFYCKDSSDNWTDASASVHSVTVSILAITAHEDPRFSGVQSFSPASATVPADDWTTQNKHRGSFATFTVRCRNMEL